MTPTIPPADFAAYLVAVIKNPEKHPIMRAALISEYHRHYQAFAWKDLAKRYRRLLLAELSGSKKLRDRLVVEVGRRQKMEKERVIN